MFFIWLKVIRKINIIEEKSGLNGKSFSVFLPFSISELTLKERELERNAHN